MATTQSELAQQKRSSRGRLDVAPCECVDDVTGEACREPAMAGTTYCERHRCMHLLPNGSRCANHVVGAGRFCETHRSVISALETLADLQVLKVVTEQYRQDLREFWQRTSIYVAGHGALLTACAFVVSGAGDGPRHRLLLLVMGLVGLILASIWIPVSRKSREWIRFWRTEVVRVDTVVDRHLAYHLELFSEPNKWGQTRTSHTHDADLIASRKVWRSPTGLTLILPWLFLAIWLGMCVYFAFLV